MKLIFIDGINKFALAVQHIFILCDNTERLLEFRRVLNQFNHIILMYSMIDLIIINCNHSIKFI